jgi:hypothetical protein
MRGKCVAISQTATPSNVETEVAAFGRRRDVHVSTERKLAIHAIPDKYKNHVLSISAAGSLIVSLG